MFNLQKLEAMEIREETSRIERVRATIILEECLSKWKDNAKKEEFSNILNFEKDFKERIK